MLPLHPLLHYLLGLLLLVVEFLDVASHVHLVDLEMSQSIVDSSLLLVQLDLFEGEFVGLGFGEHLGLDHLFGKSLLTYDFSLLELSELAIDFSSLLDSSLCLLLDIDTLLLILSDQVIETIPDLLLLSEKKLFSLGQIIVSLIQINRLLLKSIDLRFLLLDVVLEIADGRLSGTRVVNMQVFKHFLDSVDFLTFKAELINVVKWMTIVSVWVVEWWQFGA